MVFLTHQVNYEYWTTNHSFFQIYEVHIHCRFQPNLFTPMLLITLVEPPFSPHIVQWTLSWFYNSLLASHVDTYWNIKLNQGSYLSMIVFKLSTLQIIWKGLCIGEWLVIMSTFLQCTLPPLKVIKCKTKYTYMQKTTIDQGPFIKTLSFNCWFRCAHDN